MKWKTSHHPYAMTTVVFWALAAPLTQIARECFSPGPLGFLRYLTASCLLLPIAVLCRFPLPRRRDLPWFLLSGFFGFFLYMLTFNRGQALVTAATGSLVIATAPVITALLARFVYDEALRPLQWAAIVLEFLGVAVLALLKGAFSANPGLLWMALAALSMSTYNLLQRRLTKTYSGLQCSAYSIMAGTLLLAVFAPSALGEAAEASLRSWVCLLLLGTACGVLAYVSWAMAFSRAKQTSQVSNYMFLNPFLASLFGFLIAGELPDLAMLLGGAVILGGMLLFHRGAARSPVPGGPDARS